MTKRGRSRRERKKKENSSKQLQETSTKRRTHPRVRHRISCGYSYLAVECVQERVTSAVGHSTAAVRLTALAKVQALSAKRTLVDLAILSPREGHAVVLQLQRQRSKERRRENERKKNSGGKDTHVSYDRSGPTKPPRAHRAPAASSCLVAGVTKHPLAFRYCRALSKFKTFLSHAPQSPPLVLPGTCSGWRPGRPASHCP